MTDICNKNREKKTGWDAETYKLASEIQNNCCAICGKKADNRKLAADHDHSSGNIRALLCSNCNTALGLAKESPELLFKMIKYILFYQKKGTSTYIHADLESLSIPDLNEVLKPYINLQINIEDNKNGIV